MIFLQGRSMPLTQGCFIMEVKIRQQKQKASSWKGQAKGLKSEKEKVNNNKLEREMGINR